MKKVLLTAMTLVGIASSTVFGMYGKGDSWIDFLAHGNQFRARMDQLGFTLGNGTIKGTFGFKANSGAMGSIISSGFDAEKNEKTSENLDATISAGIGYTSEMIGIGIGYNYTFVNSHLAVHTPVLMINALNNNLRISAPIQVAVTDDYYGHDSKVKYTGVAFNNIQLRYTTGIDAFNHLRFYAYYRNSTLESDFGKSTSEALGFQLRLYFLNTTVGNAAINPYIRLEYHTVLKGYGDSLGKYGAEDVMTGIPEDVKQSDTHEVNPFQVKVMPTLALSANSDVVSLLFEPSLGYTVYSEKRKGMDQVTTHALKWGAYTELYFTPVKDLEWYFEIDVNGAVTGKQGKVANTDLSPVYFESSTGLTWYLPSLDGSAQ